MCKHRSISPYFPRSFLLFLSLPLSLSLLSLFLSPKSGHCLFLYSVSTLHPQSDVLISCDSFGLVDTLVSTLLSAELLQFANRPQCNGILRRNKMRSGEDLTAFQEASKHVPAARDLFCPVEDVKGAVNTTPRIRTPLVTSSKLFRQSIV